MIVAKIFPQSCEDCRPPTEWKASRDSLPFPARLPLLIVAVVLGVATLIAAAIRLSETLAINPWEPAIAMEAVRLNAGLPVYESEHATHMYGPLLTVLLAGVFRFAGLNLIAARIAMSILSCGLAIFLAAIFNRGKSWLWFALLLFLGINFRTNLMFLSAQSDGVAALLGVAAIYFWITGYSVVAILAFVGAMFFKQTAAAFALIPIAYALMWQRPRILRDLLKSFVPVISIFVAIAGIGWFSPELFRGMITVPASIKVHPERIPPATLYLFATFPLFFVALLALLSKRRPIDSRERWILAALIVFIPTSIWIICKSGGSYNSFLFAYLAMTALLVTRLDVVADWLSSFSIQRAALASTLVSLVVLLSFFLQFNQVEALLSAHHGDEKVQRRRRRCPLLEGHLARGPDDCLSRIGIYRPLAFFRARCAYSKWGLAGRIACVDPPRDRPNQLRHAGARICADAGFRPRTIAPELSASCD